MTRSVGCCKADFFEVQRTSAMDTVRGSGYHLEQCLLGHRQPMKNVTKNQGDVVELSSIICFQGHMSPRLKVCYHCSQLTTGPSGWSRTVLSSV